MNEIQRTLTYFAEDGNYGNADRMVVMETTHWSEVDWDIIEKVSDSDRPTVARLLTESYEKDADNDFIRKKLEDDYGLDFSEEEDD